VFAAAHLRVGAHVQLEAGRRVGQQHLRLDEGVCPHTGGWWLGVSLNVCRCVCLCVRQCVRRQCVCMCVCVWLGLVGLHCGEQS
jgi:hypothetical protein